MDQNHETWTEENAKNNHIVKSMYAYYSDNSVINYELFITELLKYKIEERNGQINSAAIDILALYLNFSDNTDFIKNWLRELKETLILDGIIL